MPTTPIPTAEQALLSEQQRLQRLLEYARLWAVDEFECWLIVERRIEEMKRQ